MGHILREKSEAFEQAKELFKKNQIKKGYCIKRIRSDHGKEFENAKFFEFCDENDIVQEFTAPITPQQNGITKRKNRTIQEMDRTMIHCKIRATYFWGEAINTVCHLINLRSSRDKSPYEWCKGKNPIAKYFHVFKGKCFILRDWENLGKRVYNKRKKTIMETINVVIDDDSSDAPCEGEVQIVEGGKEVATEKTSEDLGKPSDVESIEEPSTPKHKMITKETTSRL
jgi:hypothetical protein